jgi:choline dehydrogenase-like flavoprotein
VLPFDPARFTTRLWQFSPPTRFGETYRPALAAAPNLRAMLNADVVDILTNEAGSEVAELQVATLDGKRFGVRAPTVVLACGGLENARLLLAARQTINVGLGNQHDNVGRYFMEHPHLAAARVLLDDPQRVRFYDPDIPAAHRAGHKVVGCLKLRRKVQAEAGLLNCDCNFLVDNVGTSGYAALRRIWNAAERGALPEHLWADLGAALADLDDTAAGLLGRFGVREYLPDHTRYFMWSTAEQSPDPASRVVLGDERDALGMPRIKLDWRLNELDRQSLRAVQQTIAQEFGRTGIGRLRINPWLDEPPAAWEMMGGSHHMGNTRMSATPEQGVVDADCRVHGSANLYIAGSSVFPTGGSANPTLTIVALALRLADHLAERAIAQS